MAIILALLGSLSGIIAGLAALLAYDASLWQALGVWIGTGIFSTILGLAIAAMPQRQTAIRLKAA